MKLVFILSLLLVVLSAIRLAEGQRAAAVVIATADGTAQLLPPHELQRIIVATHQRAQKVFAHVPRRIRDKIEARMRIPVLLVLFRLALLRHLLPTLYLPLLIGALEGSWARHNQQAIVKIHSPMLFRASTLALASLPLIPVVWLLAPVAIPAGVIPAVEFPIMILALRNLILHTPSHF
jgi:hypothetical protein